MYPTGWPKSKLNFLNEMTWKDLGTFYKLNFSNWRMTMHIWNIEIIMWFHNIPMTILFKKWGLILVTLYKVCTWLYATMLMICGSFYQKLKTFPKKCRKSLSQQFLRLLFGVNCSYKVGDTKRTINFVLSHGIFQRLWCTTHSTTLY